MFTFTKSSFIRLAHKSKSKLQLQVIFYVLPILYVICFARRVNRK